ncbi:hypothetical protein [Brevundimonas sp.]|uniref:hypothetical protein n=1 Tax=Brevundimonas sp. TaxID=1871086 RepID=UPI002FCA498E
MTTDLYRRYRRALQAEPTTGRIMPYNWSPLTGGLSPALFLYSEMLEDFAREIANSINDLTQRELRLRAWHAVLKDETPKRIMDAHHAIVGDVGTVALGLPYVIRSRFIFAVTHLSNQANPARDTSWRDELPEDDKIWFETADAVAGGWRRYGRFKEKAQRIGGQDYTVATGNFRNLYQHRFSPRIGLGITQMVTRTQAADGGVSYGWGGRPPLELDAVARLLVVQRDRSYAAFDAFQGLVREQSKVITAAWSS